MPSSREPAFDALRAAMLLSLLALHAAVPYMTTPLGALWPFQDRSTHFAFDLVVAFLHTFRIPLLFFVAGYFAASLYLRRGAKAFVVHRSRRIALPLVAAWLVTAPLTIAAFRVGAAAGPAPGASLASFPPAQVAVHLQWFHLWFLFDLLLYYAAACALVPLVRRLPERTKDRGLRAVDAFYRHPWAPLLAAPVTALTLLPMTSGMLETPGSFVRPPATLLADGVFVLAGWGLYLRREAVAALPARAWSRVLWGVALFAAWLALLVRLQAGEARAHLPAIALLAAACWCLVLGLAGIFVRHFAAPRRTTRYLANASYWCYLAHLPVVVWCSVGLAGVDWPSGAKYAVVLAATTGVCLSTYEIGRRLLRRPVTTNPAIASPPGVLPLRLLLVLPASAWRRNLRGHAGPTEKIFDYSVLPCLYVAAAAMPGVSVRIVNEDYEGVDFDAEVDIVGLSIMTMNAPRAYEIAARFRERGVTVIAGGFHATLNPDDVLAHVDAVCVGDGERVVPRMLEDFRAGRLGRCYQAPLADLDALPVPDRALAGRKSLFHFDVVQATRGCPHRCEFCSITAFHRHGYRQRPVADVAAECTGVGGTILFADDNLAANRRYALDLFAAIRPLRRRWFGQCSVSAAFDDELLVAAAGSGCRGMFVGFETLSETNLSDVQKEFNRPTEYAEAVQRFHAHGIVVFAGIVFGMDDDREEVFARVLRFLDEARVDLVAANILTPFPGTPLHDRLDHAGRILSRDFALYDVNHVVFSPRHMSPEALRQGTSWVRAEFYSIAAILRRLRWAARYFDAGTLLGVLLPINAGFYTALRRGPTMEHAALFRGRQSLTASSDRASPRAAVAAAAAGSAAGTGGRTPPASPASRQSRG